MKINLHIERLIVDGLPLEQGDGARLQAAVERELARLLAGGQRVTRLRADAATAHASGGSFTLAEPADAARVGRQIAGAVHAGIENTR
jgi:hypothetical protein